MQDKKPLISFNFKLDCGNNITVSDGSATFDTTTFGSTANVTCNTGYDANKASIQCLSTGAWDVATCTIKGILSFINYNWCIFLETIVNYMYVYFVFSFIFTNGLHNCSHYGWMFERTFHEYFSSAYLEQ